MLAAISAGILGAVGSILAKLLSYQELVLSGNETVNLSGPLTRTLLFAGVLLANLCMWYVFTLALATASSATIAGGISLASNFLTTVFGRL